MPIYVPSNPPSDRLWSSTPSSSKNDEPLRYLRMMSLFVIWEWWASILINPICLYRFTSLYQSTGIMSFLRHLRMMSLFIIWEWWASSLSKNDEPLRYLRMMSSSYQSTSLYRSTCLYQFTSLYQSTSLYRSTCLLRYLRTMSLNRQCRY